MFFYFINEYEQFEFNMHNNGARNPDQALFGFSVILLEMNTLFVSGVTLQFLSEVIVLWLDMTLGACRAYPP